jgi:cellulose synthase/poly-beta-1,6-N-acetylglucosamine synthase-like glycosyltransferase
MLIYFVTYLTSQVYFVWYLYCRFKKPNPNETMSLDYTVDIFLPAYKEPIWIVERALKATKKITYPHKTYLLDDSQDGRYDALGKQLKIDCLTRHGNRNRKAGNINAALEKTFGDFIAIFDIDHAPFPDFLDRTLSYFKDPQVGVVQVMQTFCNAKDGLIAEASVQTALEYFNITGVCKNNVGAMSHHGSNAVIRRMALESIGGYQSGLAEDLETSLDLHAKGWKSKYVCEPLAPGFAPADFRAFCTQQLKWSKGVFVAAQRSFFDGTFFRLTWHQRLAYSIRYSYYLVGLSTLIRQLFKKLILRIKGETLKTELHATSTIPDDIKNEA